jgi:hypothetical protein
MNRLKTKIEPTRYPRLAKAKLMKGVQVPEVPEGGWTSESFSRDGVRLIQAVNRMAVLMQRRAAAHIASRVSTVLDRALRDVVRGALNQENTLQPKAARIELNLDAQLDAFNIALEGALGTVQAELMLEVVPAIQSLMGAAYDRLTAAMGSQLNQVQAVRDFAAQAEGLAGRIVGVSETTRERVANLVARNIREGQSVLETARGIVDEGAGINARRALTIARTEMSNAWHQAATRSFKDTPTLTHVSVIGCQAREPNSPQYRGESTCNIQDVPVEDAGLLTFHPNHTGNIVPSRFANSAGAYGIGGDSGVTRLDGCSSMLAKV